MKDQNITDITFPYGASYYPIVFDEKDWERDLARMADAGMNLIRTNDIHGSWDRLEPSRGEIRIDLLERFFNLAGKYDFKILLSTGAASPPLWMAYKYPDIRIISSRGEPYPLGGTYHWFCINHPGYQEEQERFLKFLVSWAVKRPEMFGWQISNELGFPFLPTRELGRSPQNPPTGENPAATDQDRSIQTFGAGPSRLDLYCYCPHCHEKFREWLRAKYGTLEALTEAWTWSATTHAYTKWEYVTPPEMSPVGWSSVTRWIDWRLFWQDKFAEFSQIQHQLIRKYGSNHPSMVNMFIFQLNNRYGTYGGVDQWKIAEVVDHVGYDQYPGLFEKIRNLPSSMHLDHGRAVGRSVDRDLWIAELECGPIGGWVLGPVHNTNASDIERYVFECLGHDAKLINFMTWKEWDYQPIHWGALVDLDGELTPLTRAAARMGNYIKANTDFLKTSSVPQGEIAILDSRPNAILFNGLEEEETLFAAQRGAYLSFWEQGYTVDFVSPKMIREGALSGYRVLCLPLVALLDQETVASILQYAESGGLVIGFARCSMLDGRGWYNHQIPVAGLREVFGLSVQSTEQSGDIKIQFGDHQYPGYIQVETLVPETDAEILGHFLDGAPAIVLNPIGNGFGLYFATLADAAKTAFSSELLKDVGGHVLNRLGIQPMITFLPKDFDRHTVDYHLLMANGRSTILFTKHNLKKVKTELEFTAGSKVIDVRSGVEEKKSVEFKQQGNTVRIAIGFQEDEVVQAMDILWE